MRVLLSLKLLKSKSSNFFYTWMFRFRWNFTICSSLQTTWRLFSHNEQIKNEIDAPSLGTDLTYNTKKSYDRFEGVLNEFTSRKSMNLEEELWIKDMLSSQLNAVVLLSINVLKLFNL